MKYTITRTKLANTYRTPLFDVKVYKLGPNIRPLVVFSNGYDAAGVYIDRKETADLLRNKFKNHIDRRNG